MQRVVFDQPYEFIPPHRGRCWPTFLRKLVPWYMRKAYGVVGAEVRGAELVRHSIAQGHGVLWAPNHSRLADPLAMGFLARETGCVIYAMASWHVFLESRLARFMSPKLGAFSVYREGLDRASLNFAIDALATAERPLLIFPEGVTSRHNDLVNPLMDGVAMVARAAARKREKQSPRGKVVIHPIALKYLFRGDLAASVEPVLSEIETRLLWRPRRHRSLYARIGDIGQAILALKEIEYLGRPQRGRIHRRVQALIDYLLAPLEQEWLGESGAGTVVGRVKRLRTAVLPDLIKGDLDAAERDRRWKQLRDMYLAQQLGFYPADYLESCPTRERFLETVERFEEDLDDKSRTHRPWELVMQVGPAIEVSPEKVRGGDPDPLTDEIERQLKAMVAELAKESPADETLLRR